MAISGHANVYVMQINETQYIDAQDEKELKGRYINNGTPSGVRNNARMPRGRRINTCPTTGKAWVSIVAIRTILPGEEILMTYGTAWA